MRKVIAALNIFFIVYVMSLPHFDSPSILSTPLTTPPSSYHTQHSSCPKVIPSTPLSITYHNLTPLRGPSPHITQAQAQAQVQAQVHTYIPLQSSIRIIRAPLRTNQSNHLNNPLKISLNLHTLLTLYFSRKKTRIYPSFSRDVLGFYLGSGLGSSRLWVNRGEFMHARLLSL